MRKIKTCRRCKYFSKQKKIHFYICRNSKSEYFNRRFPHGKTPNACRSYKGKPETYVGPYIDYDEIEGMRFVESLRGEYPDSEFWIIGTDPNLDFYPDDFFDDKLSITLNFACIGFPNSTYFCSGHTRVAKAIVEKLGSEYLDKCIFDAKVRKPCDTEWLIWWENWGLDPIYAKFLRKPVAEHDDKDKERMIEQLTDEGLFELIGGKGVVNSAMQVAALLGAKKIILVGCSGKGTSLHYYAQKRGMSEFYEKGKIKPSHLNIWKTGRARFQVSTSQEAMMLVKLFKKHNIEIVRHRFDEEKGEFTFEEIGEQWDGIREQSNEPARERD